MHIFSAVLPLALLVLCYSSSDLNMVWGEWKIKHRKDYDNQVGLCPFIDMHIHTYWLSDHAVTDFVLDWDCTQESSMGEEHAAGSETQSRGFWRKTELHTGAKPPGWHGETLLPSNTLCFWSPAHKTCRRLKTATKQIFEFLTTDRRIRLITCLKLKGACILFICIFFFTSS